VGRKKVSTTPFTDLVGLLAVPTEKEKKTPKEPPKRYIDRGGGFITKSDMVMTPEEYRKFLKDTNDGKDLGVSPYCTYMARDTESQTVHIFTGECLVTVLSFLTVPALFPWRGKGLLPYKCIMTPRQRKSGRYRWGMMNLTCKHLIYHGAAEGIAWLR